MIHACISFFLIVFIFVITPVRADITPYPNIKSAVDSGTLPDAEIALLQWVNEHAQDQAARFDLARVLAWQGKGADALKQYEILLQLSPKNADYLFGKAQTLIWMQRPHEALTLLASARNIAPDYVDVWKLEIATLRNLPGNSYAQQARDLTEKAQQLFPSENWQYQGNTTPTKKIESTATTTNIGGIYEYLSDNRKYWMTTYLGASHRLNKSLSLHARIEYVSRYSLTDSALAAGASINITSKWKFNSELIVSPSPDFLPKYSLSAVAGRVLVASLNSQFGFKYTKYHETNVKTGILTLEKYWRNTRWAYTFNPADVQDAGSASTHHFQANLYFKQNANLSFGYSFGDELEYISINSHIVYEIKTISLSGQYEIRHNWVSVLSLSHHWQGEQYTRSGIHLGIRYQY